MLVVRRSAYSGNLNEMEIPVSEERLEKWISSEKALDVDKEFSDLTQEQREFILSGMTSDEWNSYVKELIEQDGDLKDDWYI